jgi:hypothetical protein
MSYPTIKIPNINSASYSQIPYMQTEESKRLHLDLMNKEFILCRNLSVAITMNEKIDKISKEISFVDSEIRTLKNHERKTINRIGYGFAAIGSALFCSVSSVVGIVGGLFLAFAGGGAIGMVTPLFVIPANLCFRLFKQAIYSSHAWEEEKKAMQQSLTAIQNQRKESFKDYIQPLTSDLAAHKDDIHIPSMKLEIAEILKTVSVFEQMISNNA